ncbi:MAG: hypothetical protein F4X92_00595 [Gammaproteobacteria bacterium]|nr:hypothetical protein [Gammaproteobacteria bacterium]
MNNADIVLSGLSMQHIFWAIGWKDGHGTFSLVHPWPVERVSHRYRQLQSGSRLVLPTNRSGTST